eukprot:766957-Hanusia_phi.AAC.6
MDHLHFGTPLKSISPTDEYSPPLLQSTPPPLLNTHGMARRDSPIHLIPASISLPFLFQDVDVARILLLTCWQGGAVHNHIPRGFAAPFQARLVPSRVRVQSLRGGEPSLDGLPIAKAPGDGATGTVTVKLSINYGVDGGSIVAVGPASCFGNNDINRAPKLQRKEGERWEGTVQVPLTEGVVKYHYVVLARTHRYEARIADRSINVQGLPDGAKVYVQDSFRSPKPATLATSCFSRAVFGKGKSAKVLETQNPEVEHAKITWSPNGKSDADGVTVRFALFAPRMDAGHSVWVQVMKIAPIFVPIDFIIRESLLPWVPLVTRAKYDSSCLAYFVRMVVMFDTQVKMANIGSQVFIAQVEVPRSEFPFEYKYVIVDR